MNAMETYDLAVQEMLDDDEMLEQQQMHPLRDLADYTRRYVRQNPQTVAIASALVGFWIGWRLRL